MVFTFAESLAIGCIVMLIGVCLSIIVLTIRDIRDILKKWGWIMEVVTFLIGAIIGVLLGYLAALGDKNIK